MPLDFPASPSVNDTYTFSGRTWKWNGSGWQLTSDSVVGTTNIANDAVTYAKIQNVSATDKLLGRSTAGAGDIEEITCTAAGRALLDDADAAAQRTTLGLGTLATQSGTFSGSSSGTNTGDQTITLTGAITGSGTGSFATAIAAGVIVDADINSNAAIADTKLATITTAGKVSGDAITSGTIGGTTSIITTGTIEADNQAEVRFGEATANGSNFVGLKSAASVANNVIWTLPAADGTNGQTLTTNGSGVLSWATPAAPTAFEAGTAMLFVQTTAPTGWTKSTTHNNKALRVVSGAASSGGTTAFTTVFASRTPAGTLSSTTVTGTVGSTTLTESQMPSHSHSYANSLSTTGSASAALSRTAANTNTGAAGGGGSHNHSFSGDSHGHTFTGTAMDFAVQYVDVIIATKD